MVDKDDHVASGQFRCAVSAFADPAVLLAQSQLDPWVARRKFNQQGECFRRGTGVIGQAEFPVVIDLAEHRLHHGGEVGRRRVVNGRKDRDAGQPRFRFQRALKVRARRFGHRIYRQPGFIRRRCVEILPLPGGTSIPCLSEDGLAHRRARFGHCTRPKTKLSHSLAQHAKRARRGRFDLSIARGQFILAALRGGERRFGGC